MVQVAKEKTHTSYNGTSLAQVLLKPNNVAKNPHGKLGNPTNAQNLKMIKKNIVTRKMHVQHVGRKFFERLPALDGP